MSASYYLISEIALQTADEDYVMSAYKLLLTDEDYVMSAYKLLLTDKDCVMRGYEVKKGVKQINRCIAVCVIDNHLSLSGESGLMANA
jgi:hypothetical protein